MYTVASNTRGLGTGWQQSGSWTVPQMNRAPAVVSMTPSSGTGSSQAFTVAMTDPDGAEDIGGTLLIFNWGLTGVNGCYVIYYNSSHLLYLVSDNGASTMGPIVPGLAGRVENEKCAIDASQSAVASSGNTASLTLAVTFKAGAAGKQEAYALAYDKRGLDSGWQYLGAWTVPGANRPPSMVSISPASGTGLSQTFTIVVADPDGAGDIGGTLAIFNTGLTPQNACYLIYYNAHQALYLISDDGAGALGPVVPGRPESVQNAKCAVDASLSGVTPSGNSVALKLAITFKSAAAGNQYAYALAYDKRGLDTGWQHLGAWTVPGLNRAPAAKSISPASGTGASQTFSVVVADPDGAADIAETVGDLQLGTRQPGLVFHPIWPFTVALVSRHQRYGGYAGPHHAGCGWTG